jgi:hypothetical protein
MSRVGVLCDMDREMMLEFSRTCVRRLNDYLPLRLFLAPFQHFLDVNVLKEIEKDRLIIEHASAHFERGSKKADFDVNDIFEMTVKVDDEFVNKLSNPIFSVVIRYDEFAEIRKNRIASLVNMVLELLRNWRDEVPFHQIVKNAFTEEDYRKVLGEVLHLYNVETRILSNSFTFHGPAGKVKDLFAERLFTTMEKTAGEIAVEYTRRIYVDRGCSLASPDSTEDDGLI